MLKALSHYSDNCLLDALKIDDRQALASSAQRVHLRAQELLFDAGQQIDFVYFPVSAIVSLLYASAAGKTAEIAAVGSEGMIGVAILTGGTTMPTKVVTQCSGIAYRVSVTALRKCLAGSEGLSRVLLLYMQALLTQIAQTATCNQQHTVYQQLCRWLLTDIDRSLTSELAVEPAFIGQLLGVHVDRLMEAMQRMRDAGIVETDRNRIRVLDRARLERSGCDCYGRVRREFERLLPSVPVTEAVSDFVGAGRSGNSDLT
jgi:CRP-like cAMP-binding protein